MGFSDSVLNPRPLLRKLIKEKLTHVMCEGPMAEFDQRLEVICNWIAEQMGAQDVGGVFKVFGLDPSQVFHLKAFYETRTGKKAEDL